MDETNVTLVTCFIGSFLYHRQRVIMKKEEDEAKAKADEARRLREAAEDLQRKQDDEAQKEAARERSILLLFDRSVAS